VLDASQQAVVDHAGGPLLVLAGPGTGKTTTIVESVAARIERGFDPEAVLVLTFGRKASAEVRERVTERLSVVTREPLARTFHSYAFGLLRREAARRGQPAPRLLTGAEQTVRVRELLAGRTDRWPAAMRQAVETSGFARELRDLVLRAYERGLTPADLRRLGREHDRPEWVAAGEFMAEYAEVTALADPSAYDPAELIRAVVDMWRADPGALAAERAARTAVFVDELQDTDPAQVELLALLCGRGGDLVAVGDPDQSIYGFRGADLRAVAAFPERFRHADGRPADVVALRRSRRAGAVLLRGSRSVAVRLGPVPGGRGDHRDLEPDASLPPGHVDVAVLRSVGQEAAHIAARLREAHLVEGVPWSQMAVLVRSVAMSGPPMRRALAAAGVPVALPPDELPLAGHPAVRPLLRLVECAVRPERLADEGVAQELLVSSFGGADVLTLRRLRRALRQLELAGGGVRASDALLVDALRDPRDLTMVPDRVARPAREVARLLDAARAAAAASGATAETVLWAVWDASGLSRRWQSLAVRGGATGANADRDLDGVVALFEAVARFVDRLPGAGVEVFLDVVLDQELPTESLAARAPDRDAVTLLTAHAAKGLEWDVVAVAAVQEGSWPDLRVRGSFLGSERLVDLADSSSEMLSNAAATVATLSRLLDEERRLFYVAATRARRSLLVTAVASERDGLVPSRFLDEIDPLAPAADTTDPPERALTTPGRAMSLAPLVGELRRVVTTPGHPDAAAAARQLARLAGAGVTAAAPSTWWGLTSLSDDRPVRDDDEPVPLSPSRLETFRRCELRWFLESCGGSSSSGVSQGVGSAVHKVAELAPPGADPATLAATLNRQLAGVDLGRGWVRRQQTERAREMVDRLARWLLDRPAAAAVEQSFEVQVGRARLRGQVDRVERDEDGRARVVDYKTGSTPTDSADLVEHGQLAAYQVAASAGAFADLGLAESGGAMLVQLGKAATKKAAREQTQPPLATYDDPQWAEQMVLVAAERMAGSAFVAAENKHCSHCPVRSSCPLMEDGRVVTHAGPREPDGQAP
jgi:superfamily I DNA/RNA helicase/RecB family exonuclease